ncbi:Uncharacterised protein [Vibrio cholerae]|nr:Uncharacterised protein [Vibrio cholerae]
MQRLQVERCYGQLSIRLELSSPPKVTPSCLPP